MTREDKVNKLMLLLGSMGKVAVAFSGGVDSTFLAAAAGKALGKQVVLVTACSPSLSREEQDDVIRLATELGMEHVWRQSSELTDELFTTNGVDRCYYCKKNRFAALVGWAVAAGFPWVIEGTNYDDLQDYRPGLRALAELERIKSPLLEAELTKEDIRVISRQWGLPTWDKPSAACLVSRLVYGLEITPERLAQVEAAERVVGRYCQGQIRVRHHGQLARIEVGQDQLQTLTQPKIAATLVQELTALGFVFVTIDLQGYRMGSMNKLVNEV